MENMAYLYSLLLADGRIFFQNCTQHLAQIYQLWFLKDIYFQSQKQKLKGWGGSGQGRVAQVIENSPRKLTALWLNFQYTANKTYIFIIFLASKVESKNCKDLNEHPENPLPNSKLEKEQKKGERII
jgi:hypothetical protein